MLICLKCLRCGTLTSKALWLGKCLKMLWRDILCSWRRSWRTNWCSLLLIRLMTLRQIGSIIYSWYSLLKKIDYLINSINVISKFFMIWKFCVSRKFVMKWFFYVNSLAGVESRTLRKALTIITSWFKSVLILDSF